MCKTHRDRPKNERNCDGCPYEIEVACYKNEIRENPEQAVEIVEKWSKEHPQKTYKQDFLEKFPNACVNLKGGEPLICRDRVYNTLGTECIGGDCTRCWNEPME